MYQRNISHLCNLGFSVKEAGDFSPKGFINLFERLEAKAGQTAWVKEILVAERRDYMARFAKSNDKLRIERDREIIAAFKARAYAEARA